MIRLAFISCSALAACASASSQDVARDVVLAEPVYKGVETRLLEGDLVSFGVTVENAGSPADVDAYAECAAAQYALIRGFGFARHLRSNVVNEGGIWRGDAVYTISPSLPSGLKTIDAEVTVSNCAENGIPTV